MGEIIDLERYRRQRNRRSGVPGGTGNRRGPDRRGDGAPRPAIDPSRRGRGELVKVEPDDKKSD